MLLRRTSKSRHVEDTDAGREGVIILPPVIFASP